jgi:hypothetical protein
VAYPFSPQWKASRIMTAGQAISLGFLTDFFVVVVALQLKYCYFINE